MIEDIHEKRKKLLEQLQELEKESEDQLKSKAKALSDEAKAFGYRLKYSLEKTDSEAPPVTEPKRTRLTGAAKKARDEEIAFKRSGGMSIDALAMEYDLNPNYIRRVIDEQSG
jgi:ElaB/YqjD/DUF883 family membrane-anchored ribosome-binding protein